MLAVNAFTQVVNDDCEHALYLGKLDGSGENICTGGTGSVH